MQQPRTRTAVGVVLIGVSLGLATAAPPGGLESPCPRQGPTPDRTRRSQRPRQGPTPDDAPQREARIEGLDVRSLPAAPELTGNRDAEDGTAAGDVAAVARGPVPPVVAALPALEGQIAAAGQRGGSSPDRVAARDGNVVARGSRALAGPRPIRRAAAEGSATSSRRAAPDMTVARRPGPRVAAGDRSGGSVRRSQPTNTARRRAPARQRVERREVIAEAPRDRSPSAAPPRVRAAPRSGDAASGRQGTIRCPRQGPTPDRTRRSQRPRQGPTPDRTRRSQRPRQGPTPDRTRRSQRPREGPTPDRTRRSQQGPTPRTRRRREPNAKPRPPRRRPNGRPRRPSVRPSGQQPRPSVRPSGQQPRPLGRRRPSARLGKRPARIATTTATTTTATTTTGTTTTGTTGTTATTTDRLGQVSEPCVAPDGSRRRRLPVRPAPSLTVPDDGTPRPSSAGPRRGGRR